MSAPKGKKGRPNGSLHCALSRNPGGILNENLIRCSYLVKFDSNRDDVSSKRTVEPKDG